MNTNFSSATLPPTGLLQMAVKPLCFLSICLILVNIASCEREKLAFNAPPEIQQYIDSFLLQASARGLDYEAAVREVRFSFDSIGENNVTGKCITNGRQVIIDSIAWKFSSTYEREFLIVHELGHCVLNRDHEDGTSVRGECNSLMRGAENNLVCWCNFMSADWRKYYYDELFAANNGNLDAVIYAGIVDLTAYIIDTLSTDQPIVWQDERYYFPVDSLDVTRDHILQIKITRWDTHDNNIFQVYLKDHVVSFRKKQVNNFAVYDRNTGHHFFYRDDDSLDLSTQDITISLVFVDNRILLYANNNLLHGFRYVRQGPPQEVRTNTLEGTSMIQTTVGYIR